jgi:hypothetical protein
MYCISYAFSLALPQRVRVLSDSFTETHWIEDHVSIPVYISTHFDMKPVQDIPWFILQIAEQGPIISQPSLLISSA